MTVHVSGLQKNRSQLLRYFDVIKYLEDRGISYITEGKNVTRGWIELQSPYANDHSYHLGVNTRSNSFSCWLSGEKGAITKLIQKLENCSWGKVDAIVAEFTDFTKAPEEDVRELKRLQAGSQILKKTFVQVTEEACPTLIRQYLAKRRYTVDLASQYECYYDAPLHISKDWKFRLIFPVYRDYELVTYVGRDITGKAELRYKNCPEEESILPAKSCIYGIDEVKEGQDILVVEGIFDKWRLSLHGIPNVVSTLGTMTTKEQHLLLKKKRPKKVWVLFDKNAEEHAYTLTKQLPFAPTEVLLLTDGKDPDLFSDVEIAELKEILNG